MVKLGSFTGRSKVFLGEIVSLQVGKTILQTRKVSLQVGNTSLLTRKVLLLDRILTRLTKF